MPEIPPELSVNVSPPTPPSSRHQPEARSGDGQPGLELEMLNGEFHNAWRCMVFFDGLSPPAVQALHK